MKNIVSQLPLISLPIEKKCTQCKKVKPLDEFYSLSRSALALRPENSKSHGKEAKCKDCKYPQRKSPRKPKKRSSLPLEMRTRNQSLKSAFGITIEDFQAMYDAQDGLCAICKKPETVLNPYTKKPRNLSVDHNHDTLKIRGLLCYACNRSLGSYEKFKALAWLYESYLEQYG